MKRGTLLLAAGLLGLWLLGGIAHAEGGNETVAAKTAGNFRVELVSPAAGAKMGDNELTVQLRDLATGQAVTRDSLRVEVVMDETDTSMMKMHGDMSTQVPTVIDLKADKAAPGRYVGKVNLSSSGDWLVRVYADPRAGQAPATFKVNAVAGGPNWLVIGGILAVIVAGVGGLALAIRRKSAPARAAAPVLEAGEA